MAKAFPLYDQLLSKGRPLNLDIKKTCVTINDLPQEHCSIILSFIYHHFLLENQFEIEFLREMITKNTSKRSVYQHPYGIKSVSGNKGAMFTMTNLPEALQFVIINYVDSVSQAEG